MNKSDFRKLHLALSVLKWANNHFSGDCVESYRLECICTDLSALLSGSEL